MLISITKTMHEDNPIVKDFHLGINMSQNLTFVEQINTVCVHSLRAAWILRTLICRERTVMLLPLVCLELIMGTNCGLHITSNI